MNISRINRNTMLWFTKYVFLISIGFAFIYPFAWGAAFLSGLS